MRNKHAQSFIKKIGTFVVLTFAFTLVFDVTSIALEMSGNAEKLFVTASMWCPAAAALITKKIYNERIGELLWQWPKTRYLLLSFFVPVLYSLITYLILWTGGFGHFYNVAFVKETALAYGLSAAPPVWPILLFVLTTGVFGVIRSCSNALGEEIGWRGFLVPELYRRYGFIKTSLVAGIVWAFWHYTVLIFGDYNNGTPFWYGLACFTVCIIAASFIFTWLTIKSGSLFPAMLLHATHNVYIQAILNPLTQSNSKTPWFIDEFGIVLPIVTIVFAVYFIRRRKELPVRVNDGTEKTSLPLTTALQLGS